MLYFLTFLCLLYVKQRSSLYSEIKKDQPVRHNAHNYLHIAKRDSCVKRENGILRLTKIDI